MNQLIHCELGNGPQASGLVTDFPDARRMKKFVRFVILHPEQPAVQK
jgi:hypothetical protein